MVLVKNLVYSLFNYIKGAQYASGRGRKTRAPTYGVRG